MVFGTSPTISGGILTGATDASGASALIVPVSGGYAPTADGSVGYDSTQEAWSAGGAGAINGHLARVLFASQGTSDTLTAATITTNETAFSQTFTIPADYLIANKMLRVTCKFLLTTSASPPTSILRLRAGGVGGTLLQVSSTAALGTNFAGFVGSASFIVCGTAASGASVNVITSYDGVLMPGAFGRTTQPVLVATNASKVLNATWQYGANTAGNSVTLAVWIIEEIN